MARKEVVSRKIPVTTALAMCVDKQKGEVIQREVRIKGIPKSEKLLNKKVAKAVEDDVIQFVKVLSVETEVKKAYIPMEDFLKVCYWD